MQIVVYLLGDKKWTDRFNEDALNETMLKQNIKWFMFLSLSHLLRTRDVAK